MIQLSGLWLKDGKNGKYFSGKLGNANILIFKNTKKQDEKHPDYILYLAEPQKKQYQHPNGARTPSQARPRNHAPGGDDFGWDPNDPGFD